MIKLLITDFDGTYVDTFQANFFAYQKAFEEHGITLTKDKYSECFGLRFDGFMKEMGIADKKLAQSLRDRKTALYPTFFDNIRVNEPLKALMGSFRKSGGLTAIASTARVENLQNALMHIGAEDDFDIILAGECVAHGKPAPDIYLKVLEKAGVEPAEALVFEDSEIGCAAAKAAGIKYIRIRAPYFENCSKNAFEN